MRASRRIDGWFSPQAAALFALLDEVQQSTRIVGDLFEIGAHHGKSAVMLCAMARQMETVGVCDLFSDQHLNVSGSGSGDRVTLEGNVRRIVPGFSRLTVYAKSSAELLPSEIGQPHRFFHVDGGHLASEALADIRLGAEVLHQLGAVVVDDAFRPEWPGVTEAVLDFLRDRSDYAPLVLGFNKLVIIPRAASAAYLRFVLDADALRTYFNLRVYSRKTVDVAGDPVTVFAIPSSRQIPELGYGVAVACWLGAALKRRVIRPKR